MWTCPTKPWVSFRGCLIGWDYPEQSTCFHGAALEFPLAPADPLREEETGQSVPSVVVRSSSEERAQKKETRP